MTKDDKFLHVLEALRSDLKEVRSDVKIIKEVQHEQGRDIRRLENKLDDLTEENKKEHEWLLDKLYESNEITYGSLDKRIKIIEKITLPQQA